MNLAEKRKELRLTMKEVAKALDVSEATISRWESGSIANMKRSKIEALAKLYNVSPLEIMGIAEEPSELKERAKDIIEHMSEEQVRAFLVMYGKK